MYWNIVLGGGTVQLKQQFCFNAIFFHKFVFFFLINVTYMIQLNTFLCNQLTN
jgi:hypothetical protein